MEALMRETGPQGGIATANAGRTATRSATPTVYTPLRFRIGGIEGIRTGAAIVGTPQDDGMVAIDVQWTPAVEPSRKVWESWVAEAARRHAGEQGEQGEEAPLTRFVSEAALVEVGRCVNGRVVITDDAAHAQSGRWVQAGRSDFVVDTPFPHQP
jgi:hypothetical protein